MRGYRSPAELRTVARLRKKKKRSARFRSRLAPTALTPFASLASGAPRQGRAPLRAAQPGLCGAAQGVGGQAQGRRRRDADGLTCCAHICVPLARTSRSLSDSSRCAAVLCVSAGRFGRNDAITYSFAVCASSVGLFECQLLLSDVASFPHLALHDGRDGSEIV